MWELPEDFHILNEKTNFNGKTIFLYISIDLIFRFRQLQKIYFWIFPRFGNEDCVEVSESSDEVNIRNNLIVILEYAEQVNLRFFDGML